MTWGATLPPNSSGKADCAAPSQPSALSNKTKNVNSPFCHLLNPLVIDLFSSLASLLSSFSPLSSSA